MRFRSPALGLLLALLATTTGCEGDVAEAEAILVADGYTNIEVGGWSFGGCGKSDTFSNEFVAQKGNYIVTGVVCSAWRKGATVRVFETVPLAPARVVTSRPKTRPTRAGADDGFLRQADSILAARAEAARQALADSLRAGVAP